MYFVWCIFGGSFFRTSSLSASNQVSIHEGSEQWYRLNMQKYSKSVPHTYQNKWDLYNIYTNARRLPARLGDGLNINMYIYTYILYICIYLLNELPLYLHVYIYIYVYIHTYIQMTPYQKKSIWKYLIFTKHLQY